MTYAEFRKLILNKSQFEVAKEIGCTPQNVQAFEKGKTKSGKILEYYVKAGYKYEWKSKGTKKAFWWIM